MQILLAFRETEDFCIEFRLLVKSKRDKAFIPKAFKAAQ